MLATRPVIITTPSTTLATTAKRTLFRVSLCVAMFGSVIVSTILLLQGGLALGHLRYFVDIGQHPLHITSTFVVVFGLVALLVFILLAFGLIRTNRTFATIAAGLLALCSLGLIVFSIWSFATLAGGHLSASINNTLTKELDQTQYATSSGNNLVHNTQKMARLEKQHQCCGLTAPVDDYRLRQPSGFASSATGGNTKGRPSPNQKSTAAVLLPISCCNEKYRDTDTNQCADAYGTNSDPLNRYNNEGCLLIITREKFQRIQQQGFTTVVAAALSVISCIALASVIRLLAEGHQVVPLRSTT